MCEIQTRVEVLIYIYKIIKEEKKKKKKKKSQKFYKKSLRMLEGAGLRCFTQLKGVIP